MCVPSLICVSMYVEIYVFFVTSQLTQYVLRTFAVCYIVVRAMLRNKYTTFCERSDLVSTK